MIRIICLVLLTSCAHTDILPVQASPTFAYKCPNVKWIDKGANRPFDKLDEVTLKNATIHCGNKTNGNVCVILIERKPNYDYYALCGKKRKYEVN